MCKPILILQHFWCETPGIFLDVLNERGIPVETVRGFMGETYPADLSAYSGVIAMGGPMGVYEEGRYPWLRQEDALLKTAIQQDLPTLGVCLGSQLIAKAASAEVKPGPRKDRLVSAHFESRGASRSAVAVFPTYLRGIRVARRYLLAATWSSVSGEFRTLSASSFSSRSACVRPPLPSRSHSRHGKDDARHFR